MTDRKEFLVDSKPVAGTPWHYRACGLDDVFLLNGFSVEETEDDGPVVTVNNIDGLQEAIGFSIIQQGNPLRPRELRFLRKAMGLTQSDLGQILRVDGQTVARYEKDQTTIPGSVDTVVRVHFLIHRLPADAKLGVLREAVDMLRALSADVPQTNLRRGFRQVDGKWDSGSLQA